MLDSIIFNVVYYAHMKTAEKLARISLWIGLGIVVTALSIFSWRVHKAWVEKIIDRRIEESQMKNVDISTHDSVVAFSDDVIIKRMNEDTPIEENTPQGDEGDVVVAPESQEMQVGEIAPEEVNDKQKEIDAKAREITDRFKLKMPND
jgi:patatin-like phospholipase/acyl hydrolase